jgi:hypothetical protein
VHDGICSDKGQCVALQSNEEGQCLRWPLSLVVESGEDSLGSVVVWRQVNQRYQDPEEAKNMHDQDDYFDGWQCTANEHIDEDTQHQHSPQKQCCVPILSHVGVWVVESRQLQNQVRDEEAR